MIIALDIVYNSIIAYNWDNPFTFLIITMILLVLFRKWKIVFFIVSTMIAAWLCHDLIIMNVRTMQQVFTLPFLVRAAGTLVIATTSTLSFIRYILS